MNNQHYEELPVSELFIAKYNRPVRNEVAKTWGKNFDMRLVGSIIVSHRDGAYYIVDGQHRVQAARIKGVKTLPCIVHEKLTYEEEADLFVELNKQRRGLLVYDIFNGQREAGDAEALELQQAVEAAGFAINRGAGTMKLQAVQVLLKILRMDGPEMVEEILNIIKDAWGGQKTANGRLILLGVWRFVGVYKYMYGRARLISTLAKTPPAEIIRGAKGDLSSRSDMTKAAMVILNVYNKGLAKKLPNRFE